MPKFAYKNDDERLMSHMVRVGFTKQEYAGLRAQSKCEGRAMSNIIREAVMMRKGKEHGSVCQDTAAGTGAEGTQQT